MMRKHITLVLCVLCSHVTLAQSIREKLMDDLFRAGSNYYAYPAPDVELTPAPKGKSPFYISTYARHGSRFLIRAKEYEEPYQLFKKAGDAGKLSELGKETLSQLADLREEARDRYGELTPLGAEQHRGIAQRMYDHFPEVFSGKAVIDAKSTVVIRCIISMENALLQLVRNNPELIIHSDASQHDMYYMNLQDSVLYKKRMPKDIYARYLEFCKKHAIYDQAMRRLFNDSVYYRDSINGYVLNQQIFKLASSVQGTEMRHHFNLFNIYTTQEIYNNWLQYNAFWYLLFGRSPWNGGTQPFIQRNLLRKIIEEADEAIAKEGHGATLRFGHETIVLPLICLLGLNGFDRQFENLEDLDINGWINFDVFPMAANVQWVFYRKNPQDKDVLFKILLNEKESWLPIPTDCEPYYHWKDFREFYLKKLDAYQE